MGSDPQTTKTLIVQPLSEGRVKRRLLITPALALRGQRWVVKYGKAYWENSNQTLSDMCWDVLEAGGEQFGYSITYHRKWWYFGKYRVLWDRSELARNDAPVCVEDGWIVDSYDLVPIVMKILKKATSRTLPGFSLTEE